MLIITLGLLVLMFGEGKTHLLLKDVECVCVFIEARKLQWRVPEDEHTHERTTKKK